MKSQMIECVGLQSREKVAFAVKELKREAPVYESRLFAGLSLHHYPVFLLLIHPAD